MTLTASRLVAGSVLLVVVFQGAAFGADTLELLNGSKIRGTVTSQSDAGVTIRTRQGMTITVPSARLHSVKTKDGQRVINERKRLTPPRRAPKVSAMKPAEKPRDTRPAYEKEQWPPAKKLVWANPGKGGSFRDAKNWRGGGAPTKDTDVVLPASDTPYIVKARRGCYTRHLTIEKNAAIIAEHGGGPLSVWGNCWIKEGGRIHFVDVVGPKHTFFRLDGGEWGKYRFTPSGLSDPWKQTPSSHIHHKMQITKFDGGSVEFLGNCAIGDEFYLSRGRMIISGEFRYNAAAGKGTFEVFDGAVLELQSGGAVAPHKAFSSMNIYNMSVYKGGTIQAGSPERPLTKDAYIRLGHEGAANSGRNGLYCAEGSKIRVYSADPNKARLVFTGVEHAGNPAASGDGKGIEVHLAGDVQLDGAVFDCVRQGGVRLADTGTPQSWKHVFFGPRNAGGAMQLYAQLAVDPDTYYHDRKYMRFNRVIEGLDIMQRATGQKIAITYPSSGKVFTHNGKVRWAPGGKAAAQRSANADDPPTARKILEAVERKAAALRPKLKGKKASSPGVMMLHGGDLRFIARGALKLKKVYPDTASCKRALQIVSEFGLALPK